MGLIKYIKKTWIDRNVTTPDDYVVTKSGGGALSSGDTVTMTVSAGVVTQEGTPVNATNLNNLENGVEALDNLALNLVRTLTMKGMV